MAATKGPEPPNPRPLTPQKTTKYKNIYLLAGKRLFQHANKGDGTTAREGDRTRNNSNKNNKTNR